MNTFALWTIIAILAVIVAILFFCLLHKPKISQCSCSGRCNCEKEALKKLAEQGALAQKIIDDERVHEMDGIKIGVLLREFHSLIFFRYLKPDFEIRFKRDLENRLESYRKQAAEESCCHDEKVATAAIYESLLQELSMSWNEEKKQA